MLQEEERELVAEALRAAIIYIQQFPGDDNPVAHVRKALSLVTTAPKVEAATDGQKQMEGDS